MEINKEIFDFWTGFNGYNDHNKAEKLCQWAGEKAYLDMNRTLTFKESITKENRKAVAKKRVDKRDKVIKIMYEAFGHVEGDYDAWHRALCDSIIAVYDGFLKKRKEEEAVREMTYGHAQKWINMTVKYMWSVYAVCPDHLSYYEKLMNKAPDFHVPLDHYILEYIDRHIDEWNFENKDEMKNWSQSWTWSRIDCYEDYQKYQASLRSALGCAPLEWELVHWLKAIHEMNAEK